jgi:subtilisin
LLGQSGVDRKFGLSTQNAVKKFQHDYKIPVDGKVGPITWGALCGIIPNSFIIQLKSTNSELIGNLRETLTAAGGTIAAIYDQFRMLNVRFERPPTNAEQFINSLKAHPAVQGIFYDAIATLGQTTSSSDQLIPRGIDRVDADKSGARSGDGVGTVDADIAIIDSGVTMNHPDLNVLPQRCLSFLPQVYPLPSCNDEINHGTMVAGIAAAKDNNIGVVGTAPGARIWALKVGATKPEFLNSDEMKALNYVAANAKDIEVVNLSFGRPGLYLPEFIAIHDVILKGVVVVVAAMNNNVDAKYISPAMYPAVITVSAITDTNGKCGGLGSASRVAPRNAFQSASSPRGISNPDDFFASYSNFGSVVDLAAPGTDIRSTDNTGSDRVGYGTSYAAPHVTGAVALYRSLHPTANPFQVDASLKNEGTKVPASGNPLIPCDGNGRGYFNDDYLTSGIPVFTDRVKEPLLYMGNIR